MDWIGGIALITGVLGVWLTIKQNILCWPLALISVMASGYDFYRSRLFGDLGLQALYFVQGVYGWVFWQQQTKSSFKSTRLPSRFRPIILLSILALSLVLYLLLVLLKGNRPLFDAVLTAASLVTTYMMTRKWAESWVLWVVIDASYVGLYVLTHLYSYALLYLVFTVMSAWGWIQWRKEALIK